ncbi:MAG: ribbon-helix-helix protein, CopG family [Ardenticatenales bacterium]|nr:ribbon-helix-helix protein, CopG family [Ardenticatenales bacterium]
MSIVMIPDALYQQVASEAAEQGQSVEALFRAALERYLEDLADSRLIRDFETRRATGQVEFRSHEDVWAELEEQERRGELPD